MIPGACGERPPTLRTPPPALSTFLMPPVHPKYLTCGHQICYEYYGRRKRTVSLTVKVDPPIIGVLEYPKIL